MKIAVIEPIGVDTKLLETLAAKLSPEVTLTCFESRTGDSEELIRRGKDADIIVLANQPLPAEKTYNGFYLRKSFNFERFFVKR